MALTHLFAPVYDARSRVLILGSFPSPKSRAFGFYYGHPQNAFWRTLAETLGVAEPEPAIHARRTFLLNSRVAVWDVLQSCEIDGADDGSIRNPVANAFRPIIESSEISAVFTTGKKATELFNKLAAAEAGLTAQYLPSTSPANRGQWHAAAYREAWAKIRAALDAATDFET
ncbi:MAG: DNA-deoxyinosine glycosylase [Oscillospiraceae bacterium]|jgi:hypoxanthine-DNA glycosylase|nr:DNA-deoxyinosine glycosylase [Oscillospiraceae bacterium]